jgi:signal transduction histidine kinase
VFSRIRYRISSKYVVITTVVMVVVFGILFFWISGRHTQLIIQQVEKQALILYRQIVLTRQWVSDHGYVLVASDPSGASDAGGRWRQIETVAGCAYTRITPAGLTRRLSRLAAGSQMYSFNITSRGQLNGHSPPDTFEQRALDLFQHGRVEPLKSIEVRGGEHVFRYAAPLRVRKSCLSCHDKGTFHVGGVGGCISVLIPFETAYRAIRRERLILFLTMSAMAVGIVAVLFFFARRMIFNPIHRIKDFTVRMRNEAFGDEAALEGDELKEFAGLCYLMDRKLKSYHQELEKKIAEATRDLSHTNQELEQANQELRALNAARVDFFSEISHELRTPLTSIKGAADILARKDSCTEPVYVNIIKKNTDHLIRTIVDFLDYSRIEAGRLELELEDTDLMELAGEVVAARRPEALKKGLEIRLEPDGSPLIPVDRHRIYQVLSNLLANAIKFSPGRGEIVVGVDDRGRHVRVYVNDQGPGIAPRYQQAVFNKFFQVPGRKAPDGLFKGSSGIGLAICRALVAAHGGKIWVESSPGAGSRFIFTLPKERKDQGQEADAPEA